MVEKLDTSSSIGIGVRWLSSPIIKASGTRENNSSNTGYLKSLLGNKAVAKYLRELHGPIHDKFKEIAELDFFQTKKYDVRVEKLIAQ